MRFGPAGRLSKYLSLPAVAGNYASTPDSPAISISGDLDIRVRLSLDDWTPAAEPVILSKGDGVADNSFLFQISAAGGLFFRWYVDGVNVFDGVNVSLGNADDEIVDIRYTLDADNGAAQHVSRVYKKNPSQLEWIQIGADIVVAGVSNMFNSAADLTLGGVSWAPVNGVKGEIFYAAIHDGIDGPIVAEFDPTLALFNASQVKARTGEIWTINTAGGGQIAQLF